MEIISVSLSIISAKLLTDCSYNSNQINYINTEFIVLCKARGLIKIKIFLLISKVYNLINNLKVFEILYTWAISLLYRATEYSYIKRIINLKTREVQLIEVRNYSLKYDWLKSAYLIL